MGRFDEAAETVGEHWQARAWIALESGELSNASAFASRCEADGWIGWWVRAWCAINDGQYKRATDACRSGLAIEPANPLLESALATACVFLKDAAGARSLIEQPQWRPPSLPVPFWAALGQIDYAFASAWRALEQRDPLLVTALRMPVCRVLQADARCQTLFDAMKLR
jgi:hypothetical protein